eukprot:COSAG01_NODE_11339_length_1954_cov_4.120755_1_plen_92_part_00
MRTTSHHRDEARRRFLNRQAPVRVLHHALVVLKEYYARQHRCGSTDADDDDTDSSSAEGRNDNDRVRDTHGAAAAADRASDGRDVVVAQPV